jgi:hypothetical protein
VLLVEGSNSFYRANFIAASSLAGFSVHTLARPLQELLDDIKALRRGIEALNKRSLEQGQPISRAEVNEVLAIVKKGTTVSVDYEALAQNLQSHLATPDTIAAAVTTGT